MFVPAGVSPDLLPIPNSIDSDFLSLKLVRQGINLDFDGDSSVITADELNLVLSQLSEFTYATLTRDV